MQGVGDFKYKKHKPVALINDTGKDNQKTFTVETKSETAWAVRTENSEVDDGISTCFTNDKIKDSIASNKWGWTNGKYSESENERTLYLYAGAGKCDLDKGTLVGTFTFTYLNGTLNYKVDVTEKSEFTEELFEILKLDIHAGNQILPQKRGNGRFAFTAAPGKFDKNIEFEPAVTSFQGSIDGLSGDIYVAVHADVDGFEPKANNGGGNP